MQITAEIEEELFNLKISIENYGHFKPANLEGHPDNRMPEEREPLEFKIESAVHEEGQIKFTAVEWSYIDAETKKYYSNLEATRIRIKNNDLSDEENEKILESIHAELEQ